MVLGALGLIALFFLTMPNSRLKHARLSRTRAAIDAERFEHLMEEANVSFTTARFLWTDLKAFYHPPLQPRPNDGLEGMIGIDRPEIEAMVTRFWSAMRGSDPLPRHFPLKNDPTVAELGRHLDQMAGWSARRAA